MSSPRELLLIPTRQATKSQSLPAKLTLTPALRMTVVDRTLVAVVVIAIEDPGPREMKVKTAAKKRRRSSLLEMTTKVSVVVAAIAEVAVAEEVVIAAAVVTVTTAEAVVAEVVAIVALEKTEVLPNIKRLTAMPCLEA